MAYTCQAEHDLYLGTALGTDPVWTVTFGGTWAEGDQVTLTIAGTVLGKWVFPDETADAIAQHFAWYINETFIEV